MKHVKKEMVVTLGVITDKHIRKQDLLVHMGHVFTHICISHLQARILTVENQIVVQHTKPYNTIIK